MNDYSSHAYEEDAYWEEDEVKRDGESYGTILMDTTAHQPTARVTTNSTPPIATDRPRAEATAEARVAKAIGKAAKATPKAKATDAAKMVAKAGEGRCERQRRWTQ